MLSILLPDLRGGGAERVNLDLALEFARQGHDVEFVLMQACGDFLAEAQAAFPVVDLGTSRVLQVPLPLARYLRQHRPDAVLAAMWPLTALAPLITRLSGCRCRVVVSEHGMLSAHYKGCSKGHRVVMRASMALGYRQAHAVVGVSRGVAADIACLANMTSRSVHVIYNPVRTLPKPDAAQLTEAEHIWNVPSGTRFLTVGSFIAVKNHPLLLRAFARVRARPEARLMLLGKGEGEAALRRLAAELGIADKVIFPGFHPDPTPFYATADLFVLSSDCEGFGNVIVEALACGTPVVSTDCPSGPAEILADGAFGTLVPVGDEQALARAMADALLRPHDKDRLRARAADFAPEIAARAYLALLTGPSA